MGRERNLGMKTIMEIKEAQFEALDGQTRTRHTIDELQAQAEVAQ